MPLKKLVDLNIVLTDFLIPNPAIGTVVKYHMVANTSCSPVPTPMHQNGRTTTTPPITLTV
jgi:hypothetical protein